MKPWAVFILAATLGAAAPAFAQPAAPAPPASPGQALFRQTCVYCHGAHGYATTLLEKQLGPGKGLLEGRTDLSPALIQHVVRHGFGGMPWYRRAELSDADLAQIVAYLTAENGQARP